ncbi:hypothetical protein CE557_368 [Cardinium endosymbiont of Sogatella furcifera]|uniref:hypothetical protein n=1 Tax=Cardinium endosymbiont of Sogatella furcifera TaxID=650378 RepID=UPI000E0DA76F|nr:hypothetical protein [Cardinium endosymbiont of Sogatella furcifera]AXI24192.1 hypothetical protein CE557_368 [Cardinium endosymbiont of Sogatella furcifera]
MRYLFQAICFYFQGLFKKIYLYLTLVILGTLGIIPLQAKSKSKGNLLSIAHHQETVPRQTKRKPKYMVKPGKRKSSQQDVFVKEQMNELFRSTIQLFVSTGLIFGLHQLCSKPFDLSTLVAPLIGNLAADPLEAIGRSSAMLFFPFLSKPRLNQAIDLKRQYAARKHTFSATMQSFIEQTLNRHIWAIQRFDYCNDKYVEVIQEVLQFPIGPKQIVPNTVVIN